jgi:hypothetical protein
MDTLPPHERPDLMARRPRSPGPGARYPTAPVRQFSFTDWTTNNPATPQPGDRMDSEYDRTNQSIADTINYLGVSLNTDGTLATGSVGQQQLVPGLFDFIAQDAIDQVQPLVDEAQSYANAASTSATNAGTSETDAAASANLADGAASSAAASVTAVESARADAIAYANSAGASASAASDSANHSQGSSAAAQDYSTLAAAWAEYMPDTIPPNILAIMGITGDHWSSRWWSNRATNAFGMLYELYLGVHSTPPLTTSTGSPIPLGAIYYNSVSKQPFVWDGTGWQSFWAPVKSYVLSLGYQLTGGQTVIDLTQLDLAGNNYTMNAVDPEPLDVYLNGVRLLQLVDWTMDAATSTVTLADPARAGTIAIIDIMTPPDQLAPSRTTTKLLLDFDIDPATGNPGQIDGTRTTFDLALASDSSAVSVLSSVELQVTLDGIIQKPGIDFTTLTSQITFNEAPIPGASAWAIWFS